MLTKTQMQQIQDLKLMGYTKTDIIRYYEARGEKPPSRPTISKYYDMDVVPDDPAQNSQSSKPLIQNLFGAQSFGSWKPTVGKASACHPFMMSWKRNSSKTGLMTSSPGMNRHSGITSIISRIPGRSTGSRNTGGCTTMFLIHRPANRC